MSGDVGFRTVGACGGSSALSVVGEDPCGFGGAEPAPQSGASFCVGSRAAFNGSTALEQGTDEPRGRLESGLYEVPAPVVSDSELSDSELSDSELSDSELSDSEPSDCGPPASAATSPRTQRIWNEWLETLRHDPSAAIAAALAYRQQSPDARERWLSALESDLLGDTHTRVAALAPLLAVEVDAERRARIALALQPAAAQLRSDESPEVLRAELGGGRRLAVIVSPLYLDFVQVLAVAYSPTEKLLWVRHDPLAHRSEAPVAGSEYSGSEYYGKARLEAGYHRAVVDELALTIVADGRRGGQIPDALRLIAHLF